MYVRDAHNRDEVWLLDWIEEMALDDASFRSRDYVIAVDEETNQRAGFGRVRVHKPDAGEYCEITSLGVLPEWRNQGVGAHVLERLVETAGDDGFDTLFSFTAEGAYLGQFGFESVDPDELPAPLVTRLEAVRERRPEAAPLQLDRGAFEMPARLRERFKTAGPSSGKDPEPEDTPEDFGIDPEEATYKYDTGR